MTDIARLRASLQDTSTADLVDAAAMAAQAAKEAGEVDRLFRGELFRRMQEGEAAMLVGNDAIAENVPSRSYEWHAIAVQNAIHEQGLAETDYVDATIVPEHVEYKVNTTKVRALAKKLGKVAEFDALAAISETPKIIFKMKTLGEAK